MEVLIVIIIVASLINSLAKRTKQVTQQAQSQSTVKPHKHHAAKPQQPKSQPMIRSNQTRTTPIQPRHYETIQPMVSDTGSQQGYVGSLGAGSSEGADSDEGKDMCDSSLGHAGRPQRIALSDDTTEDLSGARPDFLPERYDGSELVRAVVMNEILTRPQQRWERHARG